MDVRALGPVAGLLGGLCWVARWLVDLAVGTAGWSDSLHWVGLGLLAVALAVVGSSLVSRSAWWLRLVVAVALPLLVWSIFSVLRGDGEAIGLGGSLGMLAVVLAAATLVAGRRTAAPGIERGGRHGSHAAR